MLQPVLNLVSVSDPASAIVVVDGTGNYSASNPGGFGSPNPTFAAIANILLQVSSFKDLNSIQSLLLDSTQKAALFGAGLTLSGEDFSFGTDVFDDAVYNIGYYILYSEAATMGITAGSKQFTLTGASTIFENAVGFIMPALSTTKLYLIDRTKTLDSAGGWVTTAFDATTGGAVIQIAYEGNLKIPVYKQGYRCLIEDLGLWSELGCQDLNFRDVLTRYMYKLSLEAKFTEGYVYDAHNLIIKFAAYCSTCSC